MRRIPRIAAAVFLGAMFPLSVALPAAAADLPGSFYQRGTLYMDWFGSLAEDGTFFNQVSARVRFDLIDRPGTGWTLSLDARDRVGLIARPENQAILYNARLTFDRPSSRFYLSAGQMNLYDSAGIGELLGGVAGFKLTPDIMVGGYGGLESSPYVRLVDSHYWKFGAFFRWLGSMGKSLALSYNQLSFRGQTERRYAYANLFYPVRKLLTLYGDIEYELGPHTESRNRLSRAFINARLDLGRWVDVTGHYSTGKGLDYHQFLIEASQDPAILNTSVARFYYTAYYGVRLSLKPADGVRLSVSREQSEQKDQNVLNHTWRFSAGAWNIFGRGFSFTGDYAVNRGDLAESDSYYAAVTKEFAKFSLQASYSNTFNGIRIDTTSGVPQIIHLSDYKNAALTAFVRLSRRLMASVEYNYFLQTAANRHYFFVRLIYRTY